MEFLSINTSLPDGVGYYPWMSVKAKEVKCNNFAILPNDELPLVAPSVDLSNAVVKLTNIYEEEINFILNHNTTSFFLEAFNTSCDFYVSQNAIVKWDDREQNCRLRRLVDAQVEGAATPHWYFSVNDEMAYPMVDLFMYVEYDATIKFAPKTNDSWTFNIILESSDVASFQDATWIAQDYTKEISGQGTQYRDISWIIPQVIPKPTQGGPYFRLIMRQTAGGLGGTNGVDITVQNLFLRVSVKPYVRSIKLF